MLRGHAIVGVLAQYAAFSLRYSPLEQESGAATVLAKIEAAEIALWDASRVNKSATKLPDPELVEPVHHIDRVTAIGDLAKAAAAPAYNRAVGFFEKIAAVFSGSPVSGISLVKDARDAIRRAITGNSYADAYVDGIGKFLNKAQAEDQKTKLTDSRWLSMWQSIDDGILKSACAKLAAMANVPTPHCIPAARAK